MIRPSWPLQLLLSLLTMWSEAFCTLYFECSVSLLLISRMASSSQSGLRLMVTCSEMPFLTTSPKQLLISLTPPLITLFFCLFVCFRGEGGVSLRLRSFSFSVFCSLNIVSMRIGTSCVLFIITFPVGKSSAKYILDHPQIFAEWIDAAKLIGFIVL